MAVTVKSFRSHFPEFASASRFPEAMITYWLTVSPHLINQARWAQLFDTGVELFIAHHIVLERRAIDQANVRGGKGIPGLSVGIVNNKSVDKVSVGYDTASGSMPDAGHWNLTVFGTRFRQLMRIMGAGPIQIGMGCAPVGSGPAWPGPWNPNFPNPSQ